MSFGVAPVAPHLQTRLPFSNILRLITKKPLSYEENLLFFTLNQIPGFYLMATLAFNLNHLNYFHRSTTNKKHHNTP